MKKSKNQIKRHSSAIARVSDLLISYRLELKDIPGTFAIVAEAIGKLKGNILDIDLVSRHPGKIVRDISVLVPNRIQMDAITAVLRKGFAGRATLLQVIDKVETIHRGGKIEVVSKYPLTSFYDLSLAYTPGVARISLAIAADPLKARDFTIIGHTVGIVTDGTAVLGLGDVGPLAAMPVMEGKAMIFKRFAGLDAIPIILDVHSVEEIIRTVKAIAPGFGGINLEDIAGPKCFEIEERLDADLPIPVFHDDQHGTAIVSLGGLMNALKVVKKKMTRIRVVISGAGAAGIAIAKLLRVVGVRNIVMCDRKGILAEGRDGMNPEKTMMAQILNPERVVGPLEKALHGADVFIGVSSAGILNAKMVKTMAKDPIIFALANPDPEITPEEAVKVARVVATGRSDYSNQVNNAICYPGFFRGALDAGAKRVTTEMKLAAARAIAASVPPNRLGPECIIPEIFDPKVHEAVTQAVASAVRKFH